jgi:diaminopimelate epimerase
VGWLPLGSLEYTAFGVNLGFTKYEGLGNDFVLIDEASAPPIDDGLAIRLCDRHFGIGADGLLLTGLSQGRPYMRVINADGSRPEMCGNGLRCVALHWAQRERLGLDFEIDTDAGPHAVAVIRHGDHAGSINVAMRAASLRAGDVLRDAQGEHLDLPFEVDGRLLRFTAVSMGNPHAVLFEDVGNEIDRLGPRIERDARFGAGVNVGFARMTGPNAMTLRVWERGVGFTLACGTGACAAAVAAIETGRAAREKPVEVTLPGGSLTIRVGERKDRIQMMGPARKVFAGELEVNA